MKQVPAWLTGSILIVLTLFPGFTNATGLHKLSFDINTIETDNYYQQNYTLPLFEEFRLESDFLFSQNIANNYTVGLYYTDVTVVDDQQNNKSNSNLLFMLQFKF
jgi:hypothetical protein